MSSRNAVSARLHTTALRAAYRMLATALAALVLGTVVVVVPTQHGPDAAAQSTRAARRCPTTDILLLMDQSGSVNSADPGGAQRRAALRDYRRQTSSDSDVRVAMIGFNHEVLRHSPQFANSVMRGQPHPSDTDIDAAIPGGGFTDYRIALLEALRVYSQARPDSCLELVWFTDGLHDVEPGISADEVESAERVSSEVCRTIAPQFGEAGITTRTVLLGDNSTIPNRTTLTDPSIRRMVQASVNIIGAITAREVVAGWPVDSCPNVTGITPGDVLSISSAANLANRIVEATALARGLLHWSDCDNLGENAAVRAGRLPAGAYIDEIQVFSYGGTLSRFGVQEGSQTQWSPLAPGSRRFELTSDQLRGLGAGWRLLMEVRPDPGNAADGVTLACYSKPVSTPLEMDATIIDAQGGVSAVVLPETPYELEVDMGFYVCPVDEFTLNSDAFFAPVNAGTCAPGDSRAVFGFTGNVGQETGRVPNAEGWLMPAFAEALWAEQARLAVVAAIDGRLLPDAIADCDHSPGVYPTIETSLSGSEQARRARVLAGECVINPPREGTATVEAQGTVGGLGYHLETPEGEVLPSPLQLSPGDEPRRTRVVSDEQPAGALAATSADATLNAYWQPDGEKSPLPVQQVQFRVPTAGRAPVESAGGDQPIIIEDSLDPDDPASRVVAGEFTVNPPESGTVTVEVPESASGVEYVIETPEGEVLTNPFVLGQSEEPRTIRVVSEERSLEDLVAALDEVRIIVKTPSEVDNAVVPWVYRVESPAISQPPICRSEPYLDGDLPYRVVAAQCDLVPPVEGRLQVAVDGLPAELGYGIASPEGAFLPVPLEMRPGDEHQRILIVSRSLPWPGQRRWATEGVVTVTATWLADPGAALAAQDTFEVPAIAPEPVVCADPQMKLRNTEDDEVPDEPLRAVIVCTSRGSAPDGEFRLRLGHEESAAVDWLFESGSRVEDGGKTLVVESGEVLNEIGLVSSETLPNERIETRGTVTMSAEWMLSPLEDPLTGSVELRYELDLWPRSNLLIALLLVLLAVLATWMLFYYMMARSNRLPAAGNFFAKRVEFSTYRDERGKLRSHELATFDLDDRGSTGGSDGLVRVEGDTKRRYLRVKDLQIDAEHARWWRLPSLLRGGWGTLSVKGRDYEFAAQPHGHPHRGTTRAHFEQLLVVALETEGNRETPSGVAYVLLPRRAPRGSDPGRDLQQLLNELGGDAEPTSTRRSPREQRG